MATLWSTPASWFLNAIRNGVLAGTLSSLEENSRFVAVSASVTVAGGAVGFGVGFGVGLGVGFGVTAGVGAVVRAGLGETAASGVGVGVTGTVVAIGDGLGSAADGEETPAGDGDAVGTSLDGAAAPPQAATRTAIARMAGRRDARIFGW
jgi:hypothetical protein